MPITPGAGQTVNVYAGLTGALQTTVSGTVAVSMTNNPLTQSVSVQNVLTSSVVGTVAVSMTNNPLTQSVWVSSPVFATASVPNLTASVSNFPSGFNSNITASIPLNVTSTQANPVYVTGALEFQGSVTAVNNSVAASGSNNPLTATLIGGWDDAGKVAMWHVDTDGVGAVYISGTVAVSQTNLPATQSVWVANSQGSNVNITASITLPVSQSTSAASALWVTGNFATSFPVTQSVVANITASITLPVTMSTAAASALWVTGNFATSFPVTQSVVANITQSIPLQVTASIPGAVSVTATSANPVWVSITGGLSATFAAGTTINVTATQANPVWVSGNFATNFPVTQSVVANITQSIPLSVTSSVANPVQITGTTHIDNTSFSVTFVSQSVTGTVSIGSMPAVTFVSQSVTGSVSVNNPVTVTATAANRVSVGIFDATGADMDLFKDGDNRAIGADHGLAILGVDTGTPNKYHFLRMGTDGAVYVTASAATPVWVSGTVHMDNSTIGGGGGTQYLTGTAASTGTVVGGIDTSVNPNTFFALRKGDIDVDADSTDNTGIIAAEVYPKNFNGATWDRHRGDISGTWIKAVSGTVLPVSQSTSAATALWITGTVATAGGGAVTFVSQSVTGTVSVGNVVTVASHGVTFVSQSVTGTVTIGALPSVTFFSQSITGTVTIGAIPSHGVTFVSQSVTGTVSIGNIVSVTATAAAPVQITGTTHLDNSSLAVTFTSQSITGTVHVDNTSFATTFVSQSVTGTVHIDNTSFAVTFVSQSITGTVGLSVGTLAVSQSTTAASALWVTGNFGSSGGGVQYGTGSAGPLTGTLVLGSDGTNARAVKTDAAGQIYIANPGGAANPTSGTNFTITATGTLGGVGLIGSNAQRLGLTLFNNASTNLYISIGTTATTSSFSAMVVPNAYYELPFNFTGPLSGAWSGTPTGNALLTEMT